jgi:two-component system, NtrC family, response regulator
MMDKLLIVDDSDEIRKQLKWGLGQEYRVLLAESVPKALELFAAHQPKVMTLDLGLPPDAEGATEGLRCLREVLAQAPATKVIMLTGNEERQHALQAISLGAYDFYSKPIDLAELRVILARAFHLSRLEEENRRMHLAMGGVGSDLSGIFGQCPAMLEVFATLRKVASVDVPVLVLGESGTGKELVARALHGKSLRAGGAFIPINCGAIPENLLESELFGHEKGAFTGAQARVQGKVEYASGGTLFLDEIGEMPPLLQVKLLRFLQERVIQRVGGREDIAVDARIVAATNVDIQQAIGRGRFREDLYYRLGVISITLPPLRERGDDVHLLANLFLRRCSEAFGKRVRGFSSEALAALLAYPWPGNVRELENKVKRAVVMAETPLVEPQDLGLAAPAGPVAAEQGSVKPPTLAGLTLREARALVEKELISGEIDRQSGNIAQAAEALGVSRPTLYDLLKKYGLFVSPE